MGEEVEVDGARVGSGDFDRFSKYPATAQECDYRCYSHNSAMDNQASRKRAVLEAIFRTFHHKLHLNLKTQSF
ncbi:MAG: hypothetical protein GY742_18380 [Hyphomicrobiales bacterium]|nr:hypothetical protein [Hyphomicrobiales bacterium]